MAESDDLAAARAGGATYRRYMFLVLARKKWTIPAALAGLASILFSILGLRP